jgi:hypothetical protein
MSTAMRLVDWLSLVRQIRIWLFQAGEILDLPEVNDPSAVYGWCLTILVLARQSAELTPTEIDDRVVTWLLAGPFDSFEAFQPYYQVFRAVLELVASDESSEAIAARAVEMGGEDVGDLLAANPIGLDPVTVITVIVQVIRLILEFRGK